MDDGREKVVGLYLWNREASVFNSDLSRTDPHVANDVYLVFALL